jgi:chromosome segregation ATPase
MDSTADEDALLLTPLHEAHPHRSSDYCAGKLKAKRGRSCHTLTSTYVLCLFFLRQRIKEGYQNMGRANLVERALIANKAEEPLKDAERLLAQAEKLIAKLQSKAADQQQTIRELRSQAKLADNITAEISELKAEVTDLKDEVRELTRANREQVAKNETLQAENAKLKAEMKVRKPNGTAISASVSSMLQPSLS